MSLDRDKLKSAIAGVLGWHIDDTNLPAEVREDHNTVIQAARLVADPDTLTIWWCAKHKTSGIYRLGNRCCWGGQFERVNSIDDCRMVERVLLEGQPK